MPVRTQVPNVTLHPGALFQVLDNTGTWHAATVGTGVLCTAIRTAAHAQNHGETFDSTTTVRWDYGVDQIDCPEPACWSAVGRA